MDEKEKKVAWTIEIGFYPGIVMGIRSYEEPEHTTHVLLFTVCRLSSLSL